MSLTKHRSVAAVMFVGPWSILASWRYSHLSVSWLVLPLVRVEVKCDLSSLLSPPQGRCTRENCKYLHPPPHLKTQLEINGRNNLIQQKAAAAMLAQQMQFMLPGAQLQPIVSSPHINYNVSMNVWMFPKYLSCSLRSVRDVLLSFEGEVVFKEIFKDM